MKYGMLIGMLDNVGSHPSRGAWIEIPPPRNSRSGRRVAPLTGCVD